MTLFGSIYVIVKRAISRVVSWYYYLISCFFSLSFSFFLIFLSLNVTWSRSFLHFVVVLDAYYGEWTIVVISGIIFAFPYLWTCYYLFFLSFIFVSSNACFRINNSYGCTCQLASTSARRGECYYNVCLYLLSSGMAWMYLPWLQWGRRREREETMRVDEEQGKERDIDNFDKFIETFFEISKGSYPHPHLNNSLYGLTFSHTKIHRWLYKYLVVTKESIIDPTYLTFLQFPLILGEKNPLFFDITANIINNAIIIFLILKRTSVSTAFLF